MRYSNTGKIKENGVVYTPSKMAEYLSSEIVNYRISAYEDEISVLDPAVGGGELLISMIQIIKNKTDLRIIAVGYETDKKVCEETQEKLRSMFPDVEIKIRNEDFLDAVEAHSAGVYDFVIANPPYVRTQIMGSDKAQDIAEKLSLSGRIDIYYAFLVYTKNVLKADGVAGYITSNKFLTIKSGASVRNFILDNYQLHQITDLGDTKLFTASVLPCIIIFSLGKTTDRSEVKYTSVYETTDDIKTTKISNIFDAIYKNGCYSLPTGKRYRFQQGTIQSVERNSLWNILSEEIQTWIKKVDEKTWLRFSDIGKIRVGIKTTADNVFIGSDWSGDKEGLEWLRPLITHRNAGQILSNENEPWQVLYTHTTVNGKKKALDIDQYPKTKSYLLNHYEQLSGRKYVEKANRQWYEIWVPQNPEAWEHRKIVFRDISENPQFWLDESKAVVNGDCYWIDIYPEVFEETIYLALAIANSKFIEKFYDIKFNTKLYSGKRRYMTQYVEQFPIPYYNSETAKKIISIVKKIIAEGDQNIALSYKEELDYLVDELFA
ncbi:N-6 DNA methylase [[Clostridium] innocuum]|nr:N-6 DNA methylase [[Clostridium] innocuum]